MSVAVTQPEASVMRRGALLLAATLFAAVDADDFHEHPRKDHKGLELPAPTKSASRRFLGEVAEEDYRFPMCGFNKLRADEDAVQRFCLRQCRVESNGLVRPTFDEWTKYCRDTSSMDTWDQDCFSYLSCTYGCDVWGGDRNILRSMPIEERNSYLGDTLADMYAAGISQERRCELEKCHSYCARKELASCREAQYRQQCIGSNPDLYGCKVDCNSAAQTRIGVLMTLFVCAALLTF